MVFRLSAKLMSMSEETWFRHANPWSGWTRIFTWPFFIIAFWSRAWVGNCFLIPVAIIALWSWINPRLFPKPRTTNKWVSKGVFGEKIFVEERKKVPKHHITAAYITTTIAVIGAGILVYGLYFLEIWPTLFGGAIAFLGKIWFVDRMAWLFEDMKHLPKYKKWLY